VIVEYHRDRYGKDESLSSLHQSHPNLAILALAPTSEKSYLTRAKIEGEIRLVLPLPIEPHDLLARLQRFMDRRGSS
jgi:hypothetical protein